MAPLRLLLCRALGTLAIAALASAPLAAAAAQDSDPVIARANGVDIHESDLAFAAEEIGGNMPNLPPQQKRDYLVTYLADVIVLSQAAEQEKLPEHAAVKRRLAFERNRVLMESLLQETGHAALSPEAEHKVYDEAVKRMGTQEEVRARHILVATESEAKAIEAELKNGADFATLAKQKSKDPSAAQGGGDLGYFTKDQMVREFADVAFKLAKGQISDPVKTKFGWHIIQVEDKRVKPTPPFEQVKGQIETYVAHHAQAALVEKIRGAAKIERLDKPTAPAAANASPAATINPAAPTKK